jgi:hypothetical protein
VQDAPSTQGYNLTDGDVKSAPADARARGVPGRIRRYCHRRRDAARPALRHTVLLVSLG